MSENHARPRPIARVRHDREPVARHWLLALVALCVRPDRHPWHPDWWEKDRGAARHLLALAGLVWRPLVVLLAAATLLATQGCSAFEHLIGGSGREGSSVPMAECQLSPDYGRTYCETLTARCPVSPTLLDEGPRVGLRLRLPGSPEALQIRVQPPSGMERERPAIRISSRVREGESTVVRSRIGETFAVAVGAGPSRVEIVLDAAPLKKHCEFGCNFVVEIAGAFGAPREAMRLLQAASHDLRDLNLAFEQQNAAPELRRHLVQEAGKLPTGSCPVETLDALGKALLDLTSAVEDAHGRLYGSTSPGAFAPGRIREAEQAVTRRLREISLPDGGAALTQAYPLIDEGNTPALAMQLALMESLVRSVEPARHDEAAFWAVLLLGRTEAAWRARVPNAPELRDWAEALERIHFVQALSSGRPPPVIPGLVWNPEIKHRRLARPPSGPLCYTASSPLPVRDLAAARCRIAEWLRAPGASAPACDDSSNVPRTVVVVTGADDLGQAIRRFDQVEQLLCEGSAHLRYEPPPLAALPREAPATGPVLLSQVRALVERMRTETRLLSEIDTASIRVARELRPQVEAARQANLRQLELHTRSIGQEGLTSVRDLLREVFAVVPLQGGTGGDLARLVLPAVNEALCLAVAKWDNTWPGNLQGEIALTASAKDLPGLVPGEVPCRKQSPVSGPALVRKQEARWARLLSEQRECPLATAEQVQKAFFGGSPARLAELALPGGREFHPVPPFAFSEAGVRRLFGDGCSQSCCVELNDLHQRFSGTGQYTGGQCSAKITPGVLPSSSIQLGRVGDSETAELVCHGSRPATLELTRTPAAGDTLYIQSCAPFTVEGRLEAVPSSSSVLRVYCGGAKGFQLAIDLTSQEMRSKITGHTARLSLKPEKNRQQVWIFTTATRQ